MKNELRHTGGDGESYLYFGSVDVPTTCSRECRPSEHERIETIGGSFGPLISSLGSEFRYFLATRY